MIRLPAYAAWPPPSPWRKTSYMLPTTHFVHAFGLPQGGEWIIVLIIALLLFGSKLPAMMRGMGGSIKEFKKGMEEGTDTKNEPKKIAEAPEGAVSRDAKTSDSK